MIDFVPISVSETLPLRHIPRESDTSRLHDNLADPAEHVHDKNTQGPHRHACHEAKPTNTLIDIQRRSFAYHEGAADTTRAPPTDDRTMIVVGWIPITEAKSAAARNGGAVCRHVVDIPITVVV